MNKERMELNRKNAVIQYMRLTGNKNPELVTEAENGSYTHTNARGKKRTLIPCLHFAEYKKLLTIYPKAKMQKCQGYYVLEIR